LPFLSVVPDLKTKAPPFFFAAPSAPAESEPAAVATPEAAANTPHPVAARNPRLDISFVFMVASPPFFRIISLLRVYCYLKKLARTKGPKRHKGDSAGTSRQGVEE
jgi:hypothetical protein